MLNKNINLFPAVMLTNCIDIVTCYLQNFFTVYYFLFPMKAEHLFKWPFITLCTQKPKLCLNHLCRQQRELPNVAYCLLV